MGVQFTYQVNSTKANVTEANVKNSIANYYNASWRMHTAMNYLMFGVVENEEVRIAVGDSFSQSRSIDKAAYESQYGPGSWPYGNAAAAVEIATSEFDGDYYTDTQNFDHDATFERIFGHEVGGHLVQWYAGLDTTDSVNRNDVVIFSNLAAEEGLGDPEGLRQQPHDSSANYHTLTSLTGRFYDTSSGNTLPVLPPRDEPIPTAEDVRDWYGVSEDDDSSPLVLDIDDSGTIDLISLANSSTYWDLDQDGFRELSGWVDSSDGLLAIDLNSDGVINDNGELFGTSDTDGFTILSQYDSNDDGEINAEDAIWGDLVVWVDGNANGYSEADEMQSMSHYDIVSISLDASEVSQTNEGNRISHTGTFVVDDAVNPADTRIVHDVWFAYDDMYSFYGGEYNLDFDALLMGVSLRGYGEIPDLSIAMSMDNSATGNLLDLVSDLNDQSFADLFDETTDLRDDIRDIMFRWAGVDSVPSTTRGPSIDGRELAFLEHMMGDDYAQAKSNGTSNPGPYAAHHLEQAFEIAFNNIYARLVAQVAGKELLTGDFQYHVASDSFTGITGIDSTALSSLETEATALSTTADKTVFWGNVIRMVEFAVGTTNLSSGDQTALDDAINNSDSSLDLSTIVNNLDYVAPSGSTYNGTTGADTLTGGTGDDTLNGDSGNDTLNGGDGDDTLKGQGGDDDLYGQAGEDYLKGGNGNDTYHYDLGNGWDIISEDGTGTGNDADEIEFGSGIDSGDLTMTRYNSNGLLIEIDTGSQTGQIFVEDQFSTSGHVETIRFSDNSTISLDSLDWTTYGTDGNDTIYGIYGGNGGSGDDTMYGGDGNDKLHGSGLNTNDSTTDTLYGEDGDDQLYGENGNDVLYGGNGDDYINGGGGDDEIYDGAGNDTLIAGGGSDNFHYLSGHTTIDGNSNSTIYLDASWNGVTPDYYRIDGDLQLYFDAANTLTVVGMFSGSQITDLEYANSTTVDLSTVTYVQQGTSGNDTLDGTSGDDLLYGYAGDDELNTNGSSGNGNDTLYGGTGDDTLEGKNDDDYLDGGAGDDTMKGGSGSDHYFFVSGHDTVEEYSTDSDVLELDSSWDVEDVTMARYSTAGDDLVLTVGSTGANSITITNMFYNNRQVETLSFDGGSTTINLLTQDYTTYGTSGADNFNGVNNSNFNSGDVNDTLYGLEGNDTLSGKGGNDILYGGAGDDTLDGDGDNDTLYGGADDDTLKGGYGDDLYVYESGLDELQDNGGGTDTLWITNGVAIGDITIANSGSYDGVITINSGTDEITLHNERASSSSNQIETLLFDDGFTTDQLLDYGSWVWGTSGNDMASGNSSDNVIVGRDGNDDIDAGAGDDDIHGGDGTDDIHGDDGNDYIFGGAGGDTIYGDAGDDMICGNGDDDTIYGGAGSDTIYGDLGDDTIDGGTGIGIDTIDYSAGTSALSVNLATGTATGATGGTDTISNVERIIGTSFDDTITGSAKADILEGGDGNDYITSGGTTSATTPALNDLVDLYTPAAYWRLNETSGTTADNLGTIGSAVDGTYQNGVSLGNTALYSGGGYSADFDGSNDYISVPDDNGINTSSVSARTIELAFQADTTSGRQVLYEEGGQNNAISIYIDDGDIYFNAYNSGSWGSFTIHDSISADQTYHAALVLDVAGGELRGYLDGVEVGSGTVTSDLSGHAGDIGIGAMRDKSAYHDGSETGNGHYFDGSMSDLAIYNEVLDDATIAEHASIVTETYEAMDELHGGAGDDTLVEGDGIDVLYGDEGADIFTFGSSTAFSDVDQIADFDTSEGDAIDISDVLSGYDPQSSTITDFVQITDNGTDSTLAVDANGGGNSFTTVATILGVTGITDEAALVTNGNLIAA